MMRGYFARALTAFLGLCLALPLGVPALAAEGGEGLLVPQSLDYTEAPVDIPNPDRGFYIPNDGMVVPVSGAGKGEMEVGERPQSVANVSISTRISHVYFDLRNYSSNALTAKPKSGTSASSWSYGVSQPITQDGLAYIRAKLQEVRDSENVVLVRFTYDGEGWSYDDSKDAMRLPQIEPDKETLLTHIAQLKPIFHEYEDVIMAVDGGFFGPWGEMHSTVFGTSPEAYVWLLDALLDAVPSSRCITVHAGAFLSWYNRTYGAHYTFETIDQIPAPRPDAPEARFGLFNDSYAYGADKGDEDYPDDWGSLSEGASWEGAPLGEGYDRAKVMTWLRGQNTLYGGEAQGGQTLWNTYPFVAWEAAYAQTVYLNVDYDHNVHKRWANFSYDSMKNITVTDSKYAQYVTRPYEDRNVSVEPLYDPVYAGKNGLEYWRDRLGYRLVLRDANASAQVPGNGVLKFRGAIQNVGFGNIINAKAVSVLLKSKADGSVYRAATGIDPRTWRPSLNSLSDNRAAWHELAFSLPLDSFDKAIPTGEYQIYLKITDPKERSENKRSLRFTNKGDGIWDEALGANLIGVTQITPPETAEGYAGTLDTLNWRCTLDGELTATGSLRTGTVYAASYDETGRFLAFRELTPGESIRLEGALEKASLFWLADGTLTPQTAKILVTQHPA